MWLTDGTALDAYKLNDGAKLHLMLKDNSSDNNSKSDTATARSVKKATATASLEEELSRSLREEELICPSSPARFELPNCISLK